MRASSQIGDSEEKIREIALEMELAASTGTEERVDKNAVDDYNLHEGIFENGLNRRTTTTTTTENRQLLLSGGWLLPMYMSQGPKLAHFIPNRLTFCSYTYITVTMPFHFLSLFDLFL